MARRLDWDKDRRRHLDDKRTTAWVGEPTYKEHLNDNCDLGRGRGAEKEPSRSYMEVGSGVRPDPLPDFQVAYLLNCQSQEVTPLEPNLEVFWREGCAPFKTNFPTTDRDDALLVVAYKSRGGSLYFEVVKCRHHRSYDQTVWVTRTWVVCHHSRRINDADFLDQCAAMIPNEYLFDAYRRAALPRRPKD